MHRRAQPTEEYVLFPHTREHQLVSVRSGHIKFQRGSFPAAARRRRNNDPAVAEYRAFIKKYYTMGDPNDGFNVYGYSTAQTLVHVLKQCGDDLTRENVMRQVTSIRDLELPLLLPGIKVNTSPTDLYPIKKMQMIRFDGTRWVRFGAVLGE